MQFTTISYQSFMGPNALFRPPLTPGVNIVYIPIYKKNSHTHKINKSKKYEESHYFDYSFSVF